MIRGRLKLDINIVCLGYFLHEKDLHHENSKKYKEYIKQRPETLKRIPNLKQLTAVLDRLKWIYLGGGNLEPKTNYCVNESKVSGKL